MLTNPVDMAIVAGFALLIFGPKPPTFMGWKPETNERPPRTKDPFAKEKPKSAIKDGGSTDRHE